jgi:hypothetical protein
MEPADDMRLQSPIDCCLGGTLGSCGMQGTESVELPGPALTSWRVKLFNADVSTACLVALNDNGQHPNSIEISQSLGQKFNSPPLYLQKLSFLI